MQLPGMAGHTNARKKTSGRACADQIFVSGAIGHDVAQTNFAQGGEQPRQRKPPAAIATLSFVYCEALPRR